MPKTIPYMRGDVAVVSTGRTHRFRLSGPCMSISFFSDGTLRSRWPAYVLESTDGAYSKRLTPRDDLVPGDSEVQLRFDGLLPAKRYLLFLALRHRPLVTLSPRPELIASRSAPSGGRS